MLPLASGLSILRGGTMDTVLPHPLVLGDMLRAERVVAAEYYPHAQQHHGECHQTYDQYDLAHNNSKYGAKIRKIVESGKLKGKRFPIFTKK